MHAIVFRVNNSRLRNNGRLTIYCGDTGPLKMDAQIARDIIDGQGIVGGRVVPIETAERMDAKNRGLFYRPRRGGDFRKRYFREIKLL